LAAINAFKEVFPTVVISGCHFHLSQSIIRKVNELGLIMRYQRDDEFALHVRMLYALAYLPTDKVPDGLEVVRGLTTADGQPVVEYFDSTYVWGPVLRRTAGNEVVRRTPRCPPTLWNVSNR